MLRMKIVLLLFVKYNSMIILHKQKCKQLTEVHNNLCRYPTPIKKCLRTETLFPFNVRTILSLKTRVLHNISTGNRQIISNRPACKQTELINQPYFLALEMMFRCWPMNSSLTAMLVHNLWVIIKPQKLKLTLTKCRRLNNCNLMDTMLISRCNAKKQLIPAMNQHSSQEIWSLCNNKRRVSRHSVLNSRL